MLYVGRLSAEKGVDCLILAVAGLDDVTLRILGDGPDRQALAELAVQANANVIFEGWLDAANVRAHMLNADLLCVPSVCYEVSGLVPWRRWRLVSRSLQAIWAALGSFCITGRQDGP